MRYPKEQFTQHENLESSQKILKHRNDLILQVLEPFNISSQKIRDRFLTKHTVDTQGHELAGGMTRSVYVDLLSDPKCSEVLNMWFGHSNWQEGEQAEKIITSDLFSIFGYGFNKLKEQHNGTILMKERKQLDRPLPVPYPIHTHVEVVYFMQAHNMGQSKLSTALASMHDVTEEGWRIVRNDQGEIDTVETIKPRGLIDKFPKENLGRMLAIGVPTLTETTYEELTNKTPINKKLNAFTTSRYIQKNIHEALVQFPDMEHRLEKHYMKDPLVYGGLALQVATMTDILFAKSKNLTRNKPQLATQLQNLAVSMMEVEIGDRMGEISDVHRIISDRKDVSKGGDSPDYARQKVLFCYSKMLNMRDKIKVSAKNHNLSGHYTQALEGYEALMRIKLLDINAEMDKQGDLYKNIKRINYSEVLDFYEKIFKPIQQRADACMKDFVSQKLNTILSDAGI